MNTLEKTPLERWITAKIGLSPSSPLTRKSLEEYQLKKLQETLAYAKQNSPFYQRQLGSLATEDLTRLQDLSQLPFTTGEDLRAHDLDLLCVSQGEISRAITLQTSGTTQTPKRLYFTDDDLELTKEFFHHGMATLVQPGERVLILMPGERPGSIGDLLRQALPRFGAQAFIQESISNGEGVIENILRQKIDCLVALPIQALALARHERGAELAGRIKNVLLSADYVPQAIVHTLRQTWGCRVFTHYGMTEMGLGGGVECAARQGYHLREADLLFEVIDPASGEPLPDGEIGEVVFTTLTRRGMPLIRYRTGDLARFLPDPCPCQTLLKRMEAVRGRVENHIPLGDQHLTLAHLDEALLPIAGLLNFAAELSSEQGQTRLALTLHVLAGREAAVHQALGEALCQIPAIESLLCKGELVLVEPTFSTIPWPSNTMLKRKIIDRRLG